MRCVACTLITVALLCAGLTSRADILRWDDGQVIPGTEGITPGPGSKLANWNKASHNLQYAELSGVDLSDSDFTRSWLQSAHFSKATLSHANFAVARLTGADLSGSDLGNANLEQALLGGANLADTFLEGASFQNTTHNGFTKEQLYSTKSYADKSLKGIDFSINDLAGWDFSGQNIAGSDFSRSVFAKEQLYTTASYQQKDLNGIGLYYTDLTGWDFSGQDLRGADMYGSVFANVDLSGASFNNALMVSSTFTNADLSFADFRGSIELATSGAASIRDSIGVGGKIAGLDLNASESLVIRDDDGVPGPLPPGWRQPRPPIAITVKDHLAMADGGILELRFDADHWDSTISFQPGIPVQLGGTLKLTFAQEADPASQVGHTLELFNWTGVAPTGAFAVSSLFDWDLSHLYTTGEVTLLAAGSVIAGDANGDSKVDLGDFGTLKAHFGAAGSKADGDANGDGMVDLADFGLLKENFGKSVGPPVNAEPVPEPTSFVLVVLGLAAFATLRLKTPRQNRS